jgi:hypothetical protein
MYLLSYFFSFVLILVKIRFFLDTKDGFLHLPIQVLGGSTGLKAAQPLQVFIFELPPHISPSFCSISFSPAYDKFMLEKLPTFGEINFFNKTIVDHSSATIGEQKCL